MSTWYWDSEFVSLSVDVKYSLLCSTLMDLVDRFIPSRIRHDIPWSRCPPDWLGLLHSDAWSSYKSTRVVFGRRDARALEALENHKVVYFLLCI